jgi:predicted MPP superfamily phosphohydrolase
MAINIIFWVFTIGLISGILILKVRLDHFNPLRKQWLISSFYGLAVSSFIPKILFVLVITILYYTNFVFSETESLIVVPLAGLLSGMLPFFIIVYGIFRTLYRFKIHHVKIKFKTLPGNFKGWRIVHISDLHLGSFNYRYHILKRAVKLINQLKPDIICFTGDLVNNYAWELRGWSGVLDQLYASKGKFAVLGNHDYGDYSHWESSKLKQANFESITYFFRKIGFRLLLNESYTIEVDDEKISIIGVENWGSPPFRQYGDINKALSRAQYIPFKILLSHDPTHWNEEVRDKADIALTLSGHTHGMQAGIHLKNKKWSPIKYKYQHWAGLYEEGDQYLYVNRGLGWLGFPGRLGMRPEITSIDIE